MDSDKNAAGTSGPPLWFFLKGALGLLMLLLLTLLLEPAPPVIALRAMIGVGLAIVAGKIVLRHYGIRWPQRR